MAKTEVGKGRTIINDTGQGIEVIIPAKKNHSLIIFFALWLVGWAYGEISAIGTLLNSESETPTLFMVAWLGGWTVGGAYAIIALLYNLKGKEIVRIDGMELKHIKDLVLFKRSKEYEIAHINELRSNTSNSSMSSANNGMDFWSFTSGTVAFDYGQSTYKFGSGLDEAEAKHIVETVKQRYKSL